MISASHMRSLRVFLQGGASSTFAPCTLVQGAASPCRWAAVRGTGGTAAVANSAELMSNLTSVSFDDDITQEQLGEEYARLGKHNDSLIAEAKQLKDVAVNFSSKRKELIGRLAKGEDLSALRDDLANSYNLINNVESAMSTQRYAQFVNCRHMGSLKLTMVRKGKRSKVSDLLGVVEQALERGEEVASDGPLAAKLAELTKELQGENDGYSVAVAETVREINAMVAKLRKTALALRVRRGQSDVNEAHTLRDDIISTYYEARRKSAKMTSLRDMQALAVSHMGDIARVTRRLMLDDKVRELLKKGTKEELTLEIDSILKKVQRSQEVISVLSANQAEYAKRTDSVVVPLRAETNVTVASGEMRESLIESLREEIFCIKSKTQKRELQELYFKMVRSLRKKLQE
eukprot:TRINITY_DN506_c0_g1_i2.p1 TRINITY_DN506_c0_g1~~TRINITY_DN506_c0_g1_i2.p1  ORF type:complete len:414 (-),score=101.95 TRINITY_DN506_c0_g1_i2:71-1282(-)